MKILIADDEPLARDRLKGLVSELRLGDVIAEAANGEEVLQLSAQHQPDVILLDIRMPGMTGLETAMHLGQLETSPAIVFTTAYDEYALQAFEANAVDYLLKPVRRERLTKALEKVERLSQTQLQAIQSDETPENISARMHGGIKLVPITDIFYFQAADKYISVIHKQGTVLIEEPLKSLEQRLAEQFVRIHRNALVAKVFISALEKDDQGGFHIVLKGHDDRLEVSRRHVAEVRALLKGRV
ncbi:MAG: LytTR family DNA-binding domain-containing protein [Gammaproteobacteria bacterium]|nr:LytTR family DNA-binding domain-containing protein [Gammaproteobacteria bacterium]